MSVVNGAPEGRIRAHHVRSATMAGARNVCAARPRRAGLPVHNRVESITLAERVAKLVPHARAIGHGRMSRREPKVMLDFYHHISMCSSAPPSSREADVPTANTIITTPTNWVSRTSISTRGRVGRSDRQAYAYLLYKSDLILSEVASAAGRHPRFADLGSGFKVACAISRSAAREHPRPRTARTDDLGGVRPCMPPACGGGAGDQGEQTPEKLALQVDLSVRRIPERYIPHEHTRIIYRKMAVQRTMDDISRLDDGRATASRLRTCREGACAAELQVRCRDLVCALSRKTRAESS